MTDITGQGSWNLLIAIVSRAAAVTRVIGLCFVFLGPGLPVLVMARSKRWSAGSRWKRPKKRQKPRKTVPYRIQLLRTTEEAPGLILRLQHKSSRLRARLSAGLLLIDRSQSICVCVCVGEGVCVCVCVCVERERTSRRTGAISFGSGRL